MAANNRGAGLVLDTEKEREAVKNRLVFFAPNLMAMLEKLCDIAELHAGHLTWEDVQEARAVIEKAMERNKKAEE